ncbi:hypothetical protein RB594_003802 [Gaeumannomyces avenae]
MRSNRASHPRAFPDLSAVGFFMLPPSCQGVIKWSGGQHPLQDLPTTRHLTPESQWVTSATYYFVYGVLTATHDTAAENLMVKSMNSTMFAESCPDLRMSDLLAFTWAHAHGNENEYPRRPLRLVVMEEVLAVTRETTGGRLMLNTAEAMDLVFDALPGADGRAPCPRTERLTLRHDAADGLERRAFWFMSAQPHVARVHMMLADYPQLFRHHRIEKVHLMQAEYPPRARDDVPWDPTWGRNIALELGPMEDGIEPFGCVSAALMVLPRRPAPPPKLDWDLAEGYEMLL